MTLTIENRILRGGPAETGGKRWPRRPRDSRQEGKDKGDDQEVAALCRIEALAYQQAGEPSIVTAAFGEFAMAPINTPHVFGTDAAIVTLVIVALYPVTPI